jgi:hypothetical protein
VKLLVVLAVVVGSAVRTLAIVRVEESDPGRVARSRVLDRLYGGTTAALLAVVVLAEVLAHG